MITSLIILYIGLSLLNGIVISRNNPGVTDFKEIDRTKGLLKPYTLTILSLLISIIFFMESNVIMGILLLINTLLDLKLKT